jgi:hypothetical protein
VELNPREMLQPPAGEGVANVPGEQLLRERSTLAVNRLDVGQVAASCVDRRD